MTRQSLSMIVLAFNDGEALKELIPYLYSVLERVCDDYEIVVVDDGSRDNTEQIVQTFQASMRAIKYIKHDYNKGVGVAFNTGINAAKNKLIGYMDGDYQYDPNDIPKLLDCMTTIDIVSGYRTKRNDHFNRIIISKVYNYSIRSIYKIPLYDINSGLKIYRKTVLNSVQPIHSQGPFFDAEVLIKGLGKHYTIKEIPINHFPRKSGVSMGGSLHSIQDAIGDCLDTSFESYRSKTITCYFSIYMLKVFKVLISYLTYTWNYFEKIY